MGCGSFMFLFRLCCSGALFYFRFTHFIHILISVSSNKPYLARKNALCHFRVVDNSAFEPYSLRIISVPKNAPVHFRVTNGPDLLRFISVATASLFYLIFKIRHKAKMAEITGVLPIVSFPCLIGDE
jgi:hypothetical protein